MRGRSLGSSVRSNSAPTFMIPSAEMGRYEEVKARRHSAPVPGAARDHQEAGGRKWSGGLMPLTSAGCYGQPPVTSSGRRPSTVSLASNQGNMRPKRVKTYAAYSVSKDCAVHGPALERSEETRRMSVTSVTSQGPPVGQRRPSASASDTRDMVDRWRRSTSQGFSSSSEPVESLPPVTYQSNQTVSKKIHQRPSFRRFASFRSSLNEILYEEDEDNEEDTESINNDDEDDGMKKGRDDGRIPFSFRHDSDLADKMGVLGLSSVIRDNLRHAMTTSKHNNIYSQTQGMRKASYNSHEM